MSMMIFACSNISTKDNKLSCKFDWMDKNLDVDHYRNGDSIPEVRDSLVWANLKTGAWCYFRNDSTNGMKYGKLYNWYAISDPRGLAPEGWHIPSLAEIRNFASCLGSLDTARSKLKDYGFNGQGGLRHSSGNYTQLTIQGCWWTQTIDVKGVGYWQIFEYSPLIVIGYDNVNYGHHVRCLKN